MSEDSLAKNYCYSFLCVWFHLLRGILMLRYSPTPKEQCCLSSLLSAVDVTCPTPQEGVCTAVRRHQRSPQAEVSICCVTCRSCSTEICLTRIAQATDSPGAPGSCFKWGNKSSRTNGRSLFHAGKFLLDHACNPFIAWIISTCQLHNPSKTKVKLIYMPRRRKLTLQ